LRRARSVPGACVSREESTAKTGGDEVGGAEQIALMLPITTYWSGVRIKAYEYPNGKLSLFHRPNISGGMVPRGDWAVGKANGGWEGRVNPLLNREAGSLDTLCIRLARQYRPFSTSSTTSKPIPQGLLLEAPLAPPSVRLGPIASCTCRVSVGGLLLGEVKTQLR
jgi:hypothetical protein